MIAIQGIGNLDQTPIEEINLGCNDLNSLPLEVIAFSLVFLLREVCSSDELQRFGRYG